MRFSALLLGIISLVSSPFLTAAIYADEAYTNDFHLALLGTPQAHTTFFHRPSAASKASLLYTLSEKLVVGAVHPKDGSIVWRQRLGAGNYSTGGGFLRAGGDGTVISAANDEVHVWNAADGRLVWQWKGAGPVRGLEVDERDGNSGIIVLSEEEESKALIRKLAASNGAVLWEHVGGRYTPQAANDLNVEIVG